MFICNTLPSKNAGPNTVKILVLKGLIIVEYDFKTGTNPFRGILVIRESSSRD